MSKPVRHRGKWRIRWIDENGRRRSECHADYREAEYQLSRHRTQVEEVKRGLRTSVVADKTVGDAFDYWLKNRASAKRSGGDDESMIRRHLRPAFGGIRLRHLSVQKVDEFVVSKRDLSKKTVSNILTLLISVLNLAVELGWLHAAPRIKKPRIPKRDREYRYLKSKAEIRRLLDATVPEGEPVLVLYTTALYTGMRAGELAGLHWSDVDFDARLITVQRSFTGPTKGGELRHVPILDPLLPVLKRWRLQQPGRLVFTNRGGRMHGKSGRVFQEVLHRVLNRAGFPEQEVRGQLRRYITFHGLRHTFASHWMMSGGDLFRLQRILGHQSIEMTERYSHLSPDVFAGDHGRLGGPEEGGAVVALPNGRLAKHGADQR